MRESPLFTHGFSNTNPLSSLQTSTKWFLHNQIARKFMSKIEILLTSNPPLLISKQKLYHLTKWIFLSENWTHTLKRNMLWIFSKSTTHLWHHKRGYEINWGWKIINLSRWASYCLLQRINLHLSFSYIESHTKEHSKAACMANPNILCRQPLQLYIPTWIHSDPLYHPNLDVCRPTSSTIPVSVGSLFSKLILWHEQLQTIKEPNSNRIIDYSKVIIASY